MITRYVAALASLMRVAGLGLLSLTLLWGSALLGHARHLSGLPPEAVHVRAEDFGFGRSKPRGNGDLLVILVNFTGSSVPETLSPDYYSSVIFGDPLPLQNVSQYFQENSRGAFRLRRAGVVGPFFGIRAEGTIEKNLANAIIKAAESGFDFTRFDRNRDGTVTSDELAILMIDNGSSMGAVTRTTDPPCVAVPSSSIRVCNSRASVVGSQAPFIAIAHELYHQFVPDAEDIYGANFRLNFMLSVMAAFPGIPYDRQAIHLDAWHKIQAGWARPKIIKLPALKGRSYCEQLSHTSLHAGQPVIVYDPARFRKALRRGGEITEYFILETRGATDLIFDKNVPDPGVIVWSVQVDGTGRVRNLAGTVEPGRNGLLETTRAGDDVIVGARILAGPNRILESRIPELWRSPGVDDQYGRDASLWTIGAVRAAAEGGRGETTAYKSSTAVEILPWRDNKGSRFAFSVSPPLNTRFGIFEIELNPTTIHIESGPTEVSRSGDVRLKGHFGVIPRGLHIQSASGASTALSASRWSCKEVVVQIPASQPIGKARLYISYGARWAWQSHEVNVVH